jgi:molybdopterin molybdotransferase
MISLAEAYDIVQQTTHGFGEETIPLALGIGRVLQEDWHGDRELPPYDRITMDGIAIHYDTAVQLNHFPIAGVVAAGDPETELANAVHCLEVMTGAMLPRGCDTVIRYEDVDIVDGVARINVTYDKGQNIHYQGEDRAKGELLVEKGTLLSASEIGVGASIGKASIVVSRLPKTIIISTGNELVEIDQQPAAHQIRRSNVYRLQASLQHLNVPVNTAHLIDDEEVIVEKLQGFLRDYDLVVLSGGVSKGKFDFLPTALDRLGVTKLFHRVAQRPGKPFWFGHHTDFKATVFALPGNPVSSFMCTQIYLIDWLRTSLGMRIPERPYGILQSDVEFKPDLTYLLEVKISYNKEGQILAHPKKGHGSGDLANLLHGDAFIRLERGQSHFAAGTVHELFFYR